MVAELIPVLVMPKNGHDKARRNTFDFSKASTALDFSYAIPPLVWPSPSNEDLNFQLFAYSNILFAESAGIKEKTTRV